MNFVHDRTERNLKWARGFLGKKFKNERILYRAVAVIIDQLDNIAIRLHSCNACNFSSSIEESLAVFQLQWTHENGDPIGHVK